MVSNSVHTVYKHSHRFRLLVFGLAGILLLGLGVYNWLRPRPTAAQSVKAQFMQDVDNLDSTVRQLQRTISSQQSAPLVQSTFRRARLAYKRVEFLSAYYSPETTKALNGPNIPDVDDDLRVNAPEGFQVLEEMIFPTINRARQAEAVQHAAVLRANVNRLRLISAGNDLTDSHVFDAMRLEMFRLITLGITGFDSPLAFYSLPETADVLESLQQQLVHYNLVSHHIDLAQHLDRAFAAARASLLSAPDFDTFDRLTFITQRANVLSGLLLDAQNALNVPVFSESRLLNPSARTLTDSDVFDASYFVNFEHQRSTPDRVKLGNLLFFDPILSGQPGRSCASCHQPARAFTDGESKSLAVGMAGQPIAEHRTGRNAPTLLNAALQAVQFADSRVVFLEDQASDVIQNKDEMHGSLPQAVEALKRHPQYRALFDKAYPKGVSEATLKNAVASYIRSLTSLDSRIDQHLRGQTVALSAEEKLGFNVFMGKGKCATCHFFPLFNGTVPPAYQETESEVIGTPATAAGRQVDADVGKFIQTKREPHRYAFKTPTVRHVSRTAPYMHNGIYKTLDEVVEFYNKGGGNGLGFKLDNQTLPFDELHLTIAEKKALVAFMGAL